MLSHNLAPHTTIKQMRITRPTLTILLFLTACPPAGEETDTEVSTSSSNSASTTTEQLTEASTEVGTTTWGPMTTSTTSSGDTTLDTDETSSSGTSTVSLCGNGLVDEGEECDGNTGCFNCTQDRVVFVTGVGFAAMILGGPDGTNGADEACNSMALDSGLTGDFKAWLSTPYASPIKRFASPLGRYVRPDGVVVAASWGALLDGQLDATITVGPDGTDVGFAPVWTSTQAEGEWAGDYACDTWTSSVNTSTMGINGFTDSRWTQFGTAQCDGEFALYCFEQGGPDPCDPNPEAFKKAIGLACNMANIPAAVCESLPTEDPCVACDMLLASCPNPGSFECNSAFGLCLECVADHGTCTQQAACGLGDALCVVQ